MRFGVFFALIFSLVFLPGCVNYRNQMKDVTQDYERGQFVRAQTTLTKRAARESNTRDALVWRLEEASSRCMASDLEGSTASLEIADGIIRKYEAKPPVRIGQETLSAFSNPANISYEGWMTDRIMVSTYLGLYYMLLGQDGSARVALNKGYSRQQDAVNKNSKRIVREQQAIEDFRETKLAINNGDAQKQLQGLYGNLNDLKPIGDYVNPFSSYLHGLYLMLYGDDSADFEASRKHLERAYAFAQNNSFVREDYETAIRLSNGEALNKATTYVIFENGLGPYLEQQRVDFPIVISGRVYSLNVAFPVFMCNASQWNALDVRSGSVQRQTQELVCMDDVFGADFKAERNRIVARTIATVAIRQAASIAANEALRQTHNSAAQLVGSLAMYAAQAAVNIADTRSWTLLPHDFQVCHVPTPDNGQLQLSERRSGKSLAINVTPGEVNIVYVRYATPRGKMVAWSHQVSKHRTTY